MSRSRLLLLVAALGIAVVVARFLSSNPPAPAPERARDQQQPSEVARVLPKGAASATAPPPAAEDPHEKLAAAQRADERAVKDLETAASLRERARFPRTSRRIQDNLDPIVKTRTVKERLSPPGQGRKPTLVVFASSISYEAPSPITLFARFIREHPNDWAPRSDAEIAGELLNAADEVVAQVDLRDDGTERDIEAGDGVFTAQLTPPPEELAQWTGLIHVRVYGETADGERRSARTRFYYGAPSAKLTGKYRDALVDGHLRLEAEVDVKEPGDFRLDATLSGSRGLLAWAQDTVHLEPGTSWLAVTFWGLALREANEPGPYHLSAVALANVSTTPPQLNDASGTSYDTAAYKPQDFSNERYNDPRLLEKADRYEAKARGETARGR